MRRGPRRHLEPVCRVENWLDERPNISSMPSVCKQGVGREERNQGRDRLKGSGWAGAAQATWTSTPCRGLVRDVRLVSTQPYRMVETVPWEGPGPCRSLNSRGAGAAQAT